MTGPVEATPTWSTDAETGQHGEVRLESDDSKVILGRAAAALASTGITRGQLTFKAKGKNTSGGTPVFCIGVARSPLTVGRYDQAAANAVVIRGFNGNVYARGRSGSAKDGTSASSLKYADDDEVEFTLDLNDGSSPGTVSCTIKGTHSLLKDDLPVG